MGLEKNKKKGGSDSKTKKKTKVSTSKAADAKHKSYSDATVRKNVTTSPQHGNNDPSTPGKTKPQTRKVLQPVILKTPTGKIQKGNYQVLHKRQVNKTALKRMCDEDDSNESPSKYQKAEKIIMEKSSILQELDDLRELDVEVSPLPPSPLSNIEDMELVENDTMTEDGQGEFEVYESRNSKN